MQVDTREGNYWPLYRRSDVDRVANPGRCASKQSRPPAPDQNLAVVGHAPGLAFHVALDDVGLHVRVAGGHDGESRRRRVPIELLLAARIRRLDALDGVRILAAPCTKATLRSLLDSPPKKSPAGAGAWAPLRNAKGRESTPALRNCMSENTRYVVGAHWHSGSSAACRAGYRASEYQSEDGQRFAQSPQRVGRDRAAAAEAIAAPV